MSTDTDRKKHATSGNSAGSRPPAADQCAPAIVDNLPADIPFTVRELEVLETYLGDLIDHLLDDADSDVSEHGSTE